MPISELPKEPGEKQTVVKIEPDGLAPGVLKSDEPGGSDREEELEYTGKVVQSYLENSQGGHSEINVKVDKDNKPKLVVFFDMDKTLLHLAPIYKEAIYKVFGKNPQPTEEEKDEMWKVYFAGFNLGNSWRELYRMYLIYVKGQEQWKSDVAGYEKEIVQPNKDSIDVAGGEFYSIADGYLKIFDEKAAEVTKTFPQAEFEKFKIDQVLRLVEIYKRLGVAMVGMTANPRGFVREVLKRTGLAEKFLDCATDSDVDGMKEKKMKYLFGRLQAMGISIPYDRLMIVGDSIWADLGSAIRLKDDPDFKDVGLSVRGLLITESEEEYRKALEKVQTDPKLTEMVTVYKNEAAILDQVPRSQIGKQPPIMAGKREFLRPIGLSDNTE